MLPANFLVVWISLAKGLAYKLSQMSKLNGHLYTEVVEQPWFRYPHVVHVPIPVAQVNQSMYGRHLLPEDDIYAKHDWTDEERECLPCMNLTCVCPYYKGKVSGGNCVLPNGKLLQKAVRKETRMLSNSERNQIAVDSNLLFEDSFRLGVTLDYHIGTAHLKFVPDMSNEELLNNARIDFVLQQECIEQVLAAAMPLEAVKEKFQRSNAFQTCKIIIPDGRLLSYSHDYAHFFINGDMKETYSSTSETRDQRETDYPPPLPDCYPEMHFGNASLKDLEPYTNEEVLSNHYTDYMYEYDK
ncbi:unnamed protein product [Angiostrongylus costaricensis]|uniref:Uncharacterized protein n=1 Tax=Angiostrongylus costaricensis TaxID=334426 RepID=A0A158PLT4_ANGCS|nr:unnamed protein product [Angiostrongylus costaricensis]